MSTAQDVELLLERLGTSRLRLVRAEVEAPRILPLDWAGIGDALPDGGFPRGVVELAARRGLGGSTSVALAAVEAGQKRGMGAWCAWLDPEATLHAPGVVAAGVDLERLLVVRAPRARLGRAAVKTVASGAFEVVVVDMDPVPGAVSEEGPSLAPGGSIVRNQPRRKAWSSELLVRKLALAAEPNGATVLLLTDASRPRSTPWPVSLRLELSRPSSDGLSLRVVKDRRGRSGPAKIVPFRPVQRVVG